MTDPVAHDNFDPYHKWLGISPKDQPPHYYRLLAIDLFESDTDVISAAADKQMAFVRSFQGGKNAQFSQKILNEIAAARVCLLSEVKKAEYDDRLRARLAAGTAPGQSTGAIPVVAPPLANEAAVLTAESAGANFANSFPLDLGQDEGFEVRKTRSKNAAFLPLAALGSLAVIFAVAIAVVVSRAPKTEVSEAVKDMASASPAEANPSVVKPAAADENLPVPANSAAPQASHTRFRPSKTNDNAETKPPDKPSGADSGHLPFESTPIVRPPDKTRPGGKPPLDDDPFGDPATPAPKQEPAPKPAQAEKHKTPEEFDKMLAAAKTPEDFQAVAGEALRAASKAMDDHQPTTARQLILKSLKAARKAGDSKLIRQATRVLIKPESIKEILAEKEKEDEDPPAPLQNQDPVEESSIH